MTAFTTDTPNDICIMLMRGSTPDELLQWEQHGLRIDPKAIEQGVKLAIAELKRQSERGFAHADALERYGRRGLQVVDSGGTNEK